MKPAFLSLVAIIAISAPLFGQSADNSKPCDRSLYQSTVVQDYTELQNPPDDRVVIGHFVVDLTNPFDWCGWHVDFYADGGTINPLHRIEEYKIVARKNGKAVRYHITDTQDTSAPWGRSIDFRRIDLPDPK